MHTYMYTCAKQETDNTEKHLAGCPMPTIPASKKAEFQASLDFKVETLLSKTTAQPTSASPPSAGAPPAAHGRPWQTPQTCHVSVDPGPCGIRQKPLLPANQDRR